MNTHALHKNDNNDNEKTTQPRLSKERKKVKKQLFRLLDEKNLSISFISGVAGDRALSPSEKKKLRQLQERRGKKRFTDFLFTLTQKYYPFEHAEDIWNEILRHKESLSCILERNPGITVATMDYLFNIKKHIESPRFMSDSELTTIAKIALKDGLTQLFDSSTFYARLETEIQRYKRYQTKVSLIMIDIDDFKKFNDTYGHQEGDQILRKVADTMVQQARNLDICARYGGEEFGIILPQTDSREAAAIAERIRHQVENMKGMDYTITLSLGVACCPKDAQSLKKLVKTADEALYQSKEKGKNQVTVN